ncbi:MAG: PEP-CTERM sorting domain-containing protein [Planctomycetota bacterium]
MKNLMIAAMVAAAGSTTAQIVNYSQDFEGLVQTDAQALENDGWLVGANVFEPDGTTFLYNYFAFVAPNGGAAFSAVASGEGGPAQGAQQLSVYNDYNNADHNLGRVIEANVFREVAIDASNVGQTIEFSFDAKLGNITEAPASTASAFIKTIDPANGFATTNFLRIDDDQFSTLWSSHSISLNINAGLVGQLFQIGFLNTATSFESSGVFYDNINVAVPAPASAALLGLGGLVAARRRRA